MKQPRKLLGLLALLGLALPTISAHAAAPVITVQPITQTVLEGTNITLSVTATGTGTLDYQWRRGSTNLTTGPTLTLTNVVVGQTATNYMVIVSVATNTSLSVTSRPTPVTVLRDLDRDGMWDAWELAYGLNTNNAADALLDSDGDGLSNLDEFRLGSNPTSTNAAIQQRLVAVRYAAGSSRIGLTWNRAVGLVQLSTTNYSVVGTNGLPIAVLAVVPSANNRRATLWLEQPTGAGQSYQFVSYNPASFTLDIKNAAPPAGTTIPLGGCPPSPTNVCPNTDFCLLATYCESNPNAGVTATLNVNGGFLENASVDPDGNGAYSVTFKFLLNYATGPNTVTNTVTISGTGSSGPATCTTTVNVAAPSVTIGASPGLTICAGQSTTLMASPTGGTAPYTYSWTGPGGTTTLQTRSASAAGAYTVVVTDVNGCTGTASATVTVNALPVAAITPPSQTVCAGQNATFTASGGTSYAWTGPGGFTASTAAITRSAVTAAMAGTYTVTVTGANGCTATATATLTVNALPVAAITPASQTVCAGQNATFTSSGGATYAWTGPGGFTASTAAITRSAVTAAMAGTYTVTVTGANGCTATASATLTVRPVPTVTIGAVPNLSICPGQTTILTANPTGGTGPYTYSWSGPGGTTTFQARSASAVGTYTVIVTDANGCTGTTSATTLPCPSVITLTCPTNIVICTNDNGCGPMPDAQPLITASSTCAGLLTYSQSVSVGASVCAATGPFSVVITVSDGCGGSTNCNVPFVFERCCVQPPGNMTLWLTFDEPIGNTAFNSRGGNNGTLYDGAVPATAGTGPTHDSGGYVARSLNFDGVNDYVQVPAYSGINIGTSDFTVDAWIKPASLSSALRMIVDHREESGGSVRGYSLFLGGNNGLAFQIADGASFINYPSLVSVPADGRWHHVAVTVVRGSTTGIRFYLDGVWDGLGRDSVPFPGSLTPGSAYPFRVGARSSSLSGFFPGGIDEVEVFYRALGADEINSLWQARDKGKCKVSCHLDWDTFVCTNTTANQSVTVQGKVKNDGPNPVTVDYSFSALPPFGECALAGPTSFTPASGTVTIPGYSTVLVPTTALVPLLGSNQESCYLMTIQVQGTGEKFYCHGSFQGRTNLCVTPVTAGGVLVTYLNFTNIVRWRVSNLRNSSIALPWSVVAYNPDMLTATNVGFPGATSGTLLLAPNESVELAVPFWFRTCDFGRFYDMVFLSGTQALSSVTLVQAQPRTDCLFFAGLEHCPLGTAVLSSGTNRLVVVGLGSNGQDGVFVDLGRALSARITMEPQTPPVGAWIQFNARGQVGGVPNQTLGFTRVTRDSTNADGFLVTGNLSDAGSSTVRLEVWSNSVFVAAYPGHPSGALARVSAWPVRSGKLGPTNGTSNGPIYGCYPIYFENITDIRVSNHVHRGDQLLILQEGGTGVDHLSAFSITAANVSTFAIIREEVSHFSVNYSGLIHNPVGNASLTPHEGRLLVGNLGSSGQDGVSIDLGRVVNCSISLAPQSPPVGAWIQFAARGSVGGVANRSLGYTRVTRLSTAPDGYEIVGDLSAIAPAIRLELWSNNVMVAAFPNRPHGMLARASSWPIGTGKIGPTNSDPVGPIYGCYPIQFQDLSDFWVNGTKYVANQMRVLEEGGSGVDYLSAFSITAGNLASFQLTQVSALALQRRVTATLSGPDLTLSWFGGGILQHSSDLTNWSDILGATSPYVSFLNSSMKFYRVRQ